MTISDLHSVVFLGIGGIGMSALARFLNQKQIMVSGYDLTPSPLTHALEQEGIRIWYEDDISQLPSQMDLVVYTPAVPKDLVTFKELQLRCIPMMKRAELLGHLASEHDCLAIAGTHGKTTTSAILGHILYRSSQGCTAFIGGIVNNYQNNYFSTNSGPFVVEADEFDHSLLQLFPKIAAINSMDADHLDIYGTQKSLVDTYQQFANQVDPDGFVIVKKGLEPNFKCRAKVYTVSLNDPSSDFYTTDLRVENGRYHFNIQTPKGLMPDVVFGGVGLINVHNAVTATAMALCYGVDQKVIKEQLSSFLGVHRRLEFHVRNEKMALIDDYAHHPAELKAAIESVRVLFPNRKLTVVFQPHLFTRTRDFAEGFAASLDLADDCFLLDIYPAREKPIEGVTSEVIKKLMRNKNVRMTTKENLFNDIRESHPDVVLMLGAGDIDRLVLTMKTLLTNIMQ